MELKVRLLDGTEEKGVAQVEQELLDKHEQQFESDSVQETVQENKPEVLEETKEKPSTVSNRKGKLAESLGRQMFKDALPEIRNKKGESDQTKAMSAKKTQKDPRLLFAKKLDESLIEASQWLDKNEIADKVGFNEESLNESTRDAYQAQMEDAAEKGFLDLDVVLAGQMGSGGKQTFYGDKNNRFNGYRQAEKAVCKKQRH